MTEKIILAVIRSQASWYCLLRCLSVQDKWLLKIVLNVHSTWLEPYASLSFACALVIPKVGREKRHLADTLSHFHTHTATTERLTFRHGVERIDDHIECVTYPGTSDPAMRPRLVRDYFTEKESDLELYDRAWNLLKYLKCVKAQRIIGSLGSEVPKFRINQPKTPLQAYRTDPTFTQIFRLDGSNASGTGMQYYCGPLGYNRCAWIT